jgi:hypothetical protein
LALAVFDAEAFSFSVAAAMPLWAMAATGVTVAQSARQA